VSEKMWKIIEWLILPLQIVIALPFGILGVICIGIANLRGENGS
jgi:hypothetical protein